MEKITGKTKILGLIGWPVEHSLSPRMQNGALEAAGLNYVYVCFPTPPKNLLQAVAGIRALNITGVNVTIPHKSKVMRYLDEISGEAQRIGAVNTVINQEGRLKGYNTDVYGFLRSLSENEVDADGSSVLVFGAGGVSRAICMGIASLFPASITLTDMVMEKAYLLGEDIREAFSGVKMETIDTTAPGLVDRIKKADIICNATPVGMKNTDECILSEDQWEAVSEGTVFFDAVYNISGTKLQEEAGKRNLLYISGLDMLVYQGVRAFELFTGESPDEDVMHRVLTEILD